MARQANTKFYFIRKDNDDAYELSATTNISIDQDMISTDRPVESGKEITDNSYLKNKVVRFDGIITNVKNTSNVESTEEFLNEIAELRSASPRVLIDVVADGEFANNCLIERFSLNKDAAIGSGAWQVSMTMKEIEFSERARLVEQPEAKTAQKSTVDSTKQKSQNTKKEVPLAQTLPLASGNFLAGNIPQIPPQQTPSNSEGGG